MVRDRVGPRGSRAHGCSAVARGAIAALVVAASAPALAAKPDPGWYFGIEGFYSKLEDADATSLRVNPGLPGTPPATCILPDPLGLGPIVLGPLGCVVGTSTPGAPGQPGTTDISPAFITFKDGAGGGFNLGYLFDGGLRPELAVTYAENDIETLTVGANTGSPQDSSVSALSVLANAWFDIDAGVLRPYLGGGVGFQQTELSSGLVDESDSGFVYQLGGGLGFWVSERTILSVDYRYLKADEPTFTTDANGSELQTEYEAQRIGLGLKYLFSDAILHDSDGDGVPDRKDKCPKTPRGVQVYSDGCPLDLDGDGVPDYLDKCPGTPAGAQVNAQGCEIDSDGDGVPDSRDACPGTPRGVRVNPNGCPIDSDGDGVPDYLDKCPGTPAGAKVNEIGCELTDADRDGVPDRQDKCPGTPPGIPVGPDGCPLDSDGDGIPDYLDECPHSPPGAKVLPNGCALKGDCRKPRPGEQVDENGCALEQRFILRGVKFEFDSDRLLPESKEILNDVAATLQSYPDVSVDVEGHTDDIGTDAYNLGLSERRANAVKVYLTGRGIGASRLSPVGYGESRPIASNDQEAGREENRRVEFKVND